MTDLIYANRKPAVPFARGGDAWDVHEWLMGGSAHGISASRIAAAPEGSPWQVAEAACDRLRAISLHATAAVLDDRVAVTVSDDQGRGYELILVPADEVAAAVGQALRRGRTRYVLTAQAGSDEVAEAALAHCVTCFVVINYVEPRPERLARLRDRGCRLIAGSAFLQSHYAALRPALVEPAVDPCRYAVPAGQGDRITMINPIPPKGSATFFRLVARLPELNFLAVEGWNVASASARCQGPNLEWVPWNSDIRPVLRRTCLLLAPSVWPEAFCRAVVEAQASGIPAVVSGRGGLPATIGLGGVVVPDPYDADAWTAAVDRLCHDPGECRRLSALAVSNAARFTPEGSVRALLSLLGLGLG